MQQINVNFSQLNRCINLAGSVVAPMPPGLTTAIQTLEGPT
jgi:hypothetical protein